MKKNLLLLLSLVAATGSVSAMNHEISILKTNKDPKNNSISFDEYQKMSLLKAFITDKEVQMTREQKQKLSFLKRNAIDPFVRAVLVGTTMMATLGTFSYVAAHNGYTKTAVGLGTAAALPGIGTAFIILAPPR